MQYCASWSEKCGTTVTTSLAIDVCRQNTYETKLFVFKAVHVLENLFWSALTSKCEIVRHYNRSILM